MALGAAALAAPALGPPVAAAEPVATSPSEFVPGELIVRFRGGTSASERSAVRREQGASVERTLPVPGAQLLELQQGQSARAAAAAFEREEEVLYAEPNFVYSAALVPNDPGFPQQWGLHNIGQVVNGVQGTADADIDAPEAWDLTIGSSSVTVAVADSGVLYDHPDLAPNAWVNPGESGNGKESNLIDDDGNGLVDDRRGWDYVQNDNDPVDTAGHGTHMAGTIGAYGGNGVGVTGVSQRVSLMPLRVLDGQGNGTAAGIASAFSYASAKGSSVVNASFGGPSSSLLISNAIAAASETLFVAAAGNNGSNNDFFPAYPCNDPAPNLICVAASDQNDGLASFSNYGASSVDLAAPGTNVLSTFLEGRYAYQSGTSTAAPHVSGAAALVHALRPGSAATAVRNYLLGYGGPRPALAGRTVTGRRLNAHGALAEVAEAPPEPGPGPTGPPPAARAVTPDPAPALEPTSDTTGPSLSVTVARRQTLRTVRARGLKLNLRCDETCDASSSLLLDARTARALGLRTEGGRAVIGTATGTLRPETTTALVVKLTAKARARINRARRPRLLVRTTARDAAGNVGTATRRVTFSR